MAHFKRKKPKKYAFPTCHICMFRGPEGPTWQSGNHLATSTMGRHRASDFRKPQFYPEQEVDWDDPDMSDYSQGDLSYYWLKYSD